MQFFDDGNRCDHRPPHHAEGIFAYLNQSARPEAVAIRGALEGWFALYPQHEQATIRQRFRQEEDAAFCELVVHEMLRRAGYRITVHPSVPQTRNRPDFLIERDETRVIVECLVVGDTTRQEQSRLRLKQELLDRLNDLPSPDFYLNLVRLVVTGQPKWAWLRAFVAEKLGTVDPDALEAAFRQRQSLQVLPLWIYQDATLYAEIQPVPKPNSVRGIAGRRTVAIGPVESCISCASDDLLASLKFKAGRYGILSEPYVIMANWRGQWPLCDFEEQAAIHNLVSWRGHPRYTRVSGVLVLSCNAWNLRDASARFYHHPFTKYPLAQDWLPCSHYAMVNGVRELCKGLLVGELLGLPHGWPKVIPAHA